MIGEAGLLTLGVDLGGTKVKTALVDAEGRIMASHLHPTDPDKGQAGIIADIEACVRGCIGQASKDAIALGVGVAGQVDAATGAVRFAPNLGWRDVALQSELEKALGIRVVVTNDVRAATCGEWWHGAGRWAEDMVCLFVGTGIGGGVVSDGRLLEGSSNAAGELGHATLMVGGRRCRCPNQGCLEAYAGGWAVAERAQEAVQQDARLGETLLSMAGSVEKITAAHVATAYHDGDPLAHYLFKETGRYLAAGVVGIVNAFNPSLLVLGGGVIEGMPELVGVVEKGVRGHALSAAVQPLRVLRAALGGDAGVVGAATMARKRVMGDEADSAR
jgi:glucokinase